jgi:hypothetical protein
MKLIGFHFTKMNLEKKSDNLKDLKINTEINLLDVTEAKNSIFSSLDSLIVVKFEYIIDYDKDIASLKFYGNLIASMELKEAKEVIKQWKDKTLPDNFRLNIFNIILKKASLKALQFEEEFSLPSHIPLPSFTPQDKEK